VKNPKCQISVIIPVYCEQEVINRTIENVRSQQGGADAEIIVVDGQAEGETLAAIGDIAVRKILSEKSRGRQLNRGASVAAGDVLVFLHADTLLPPSAFARITEVMQAEGSVCGAFDLCIDSRRMAFRVIETVANLRSRLTRIPYGDQAIFISAAYLRDIGGVREIPIMEDVDLMQRIKQDGKRIVIIPEAVTTSARRWEKEGPVFGTLRNWLLMSLYVCGVAPERLARFYRMGQPR
jgi:rSAM/selenodomain-associated transferase 2